MFVKNSILGVRVTNEKRESILEQIEKSIEQNTKKYYILTPNPEIIVHAVKNPSFKTILNEADIALCDGVGVALAGRILNKPFAQRITGVDFMISLCKLSNEKPITVGFIGGRGRVAQETAERLQHQFPNLKVAFAEAGNPDENTVALVRKKTREFSTAIGQGNFLNFLFVAFGFPKQEEWIAKYLNQLPAQYSMAVGGSFDYVSGKTPRTPSFMRALGMEWLFRLILQPWRLKRQLALVEFLFLVIKEKLSSFH